MLMADEERQDNDETKVWSKRYNEARQAGMEHVDAERFANSDTDIGELRRLVDASCPADLIAEIVL